MKKLIPFDLDKALKGAKVVCRNGKIVSEWHLFTTCSSEQPLKAVIVGDCLRNYNKNGSWMSDIRQSEYDLMLEVEPTLRAWTRKEFPSDCLISMTTWDGAWVKVIEIINDNITIPYLGSLQRMSLKDLCDRGYIHSLDQGKTWLPCGVED